MEDNKKTKVLVVEDNFMSKTLVKDLLEVNGYEVVCTDKGAEAVQMAVTEKPDIVLMDINLPGMDGVTATRLIKGNDLSANIPVLALTASGMRGEEEKIVDMGFDGFVAKPIDAKELLKSIEEQLKDPA